MLNAVTPIASYSVLYVAAVVAAAAVVRLESRSLGGAEGRRLLVVLSWAVGGVVGAMLPHVILGDVVGMRTAIGAVAGASIAALIMAGATGLSAGGTLDATAVAIPLGGAIARLGCFVAGCCEGVATNLSVGIAGDDGVRRHPAQLYEAAADLGIAFLFSRRRFATLRGGQRFLLSLGTMSTVRFATEFIRESDRIGPLSLAQWLVGPAAIACFIGATRIGALRLAWSIPRNAGKILGGFSAGVVAALAVSGALSPFETNAIALCAMAMIAIAVHWRQRIAGSGMAVLMLQVMPPSTGDSLYPQLYRSIGLALSTGSYRAFHEDDASCDSGPFNEWNRFHKFVGGKLELGYLRKTSAHSGRGVRAHVQYSADHADHAIATLGTAPNPKSYTVTDASAGFVADFIGKYGAASVGVTLGRVRPLSFFDSNEDPGQPLSGYPSLGLRLGNLDGPTVELRIGDEPAGEVPGPLATLAVGLGNAKGNRVRVGISDMGYFASGTIFRPGGLEISPAFAILRGDRVDRTQGGAMVRQWRRLPDR